MNKLFTLCLLIGITGCGFGDNPTPEIRTRVEIAELQAAMVAFQEDFRVSYIPSRIKLSETGDYPQRDRPNTLDFDSVQYLRKLWPKLKLSPGCRIDWNGDGYFRGDWTLEGDECLIFFTGGIPRRSKGEATCLGFADNQRDPTVSGGRRRGPYFAFYSSRLRDLNGRGFFSYLDPHRTGRPYAYFSAYGEPNGYNRYGDTDCPRLRVSPYAEGLGAMPRFLNPDSCQIIVAGADGKFGPGTNRPSCIWTLATAGSIHSDGRDDQSNFSDRRLGVRK